MSSVTVQATPPRATHAHWLLLLAAFVLVVFHYVARADAIGVFSPVRGWTRLTMPALSPWLHFVAAGFLLGVLPVVLAVRITGWPLAAFGLGIGNWREGLRWLAIGIPLAVVAGRIGAAAQSMQSVYPLDPAMTTEPRAFVPFALIQFLYFAGWEVLFRGVLLFGLAASHGSQSAITAQTALSVVAHFGRALDETLSAIPGGLVFGWLALRLRSIWYTAIIHWTIGISVDWFILNG